MIIRDGIKIVGCVLFEILGFPWVLSGCASHSRMDLIYDGTRFHDVQGNDVEVAEVCNNFLSDRGTPLYGPCLNISLAFAPNLIAADIAEAYLKFMRKACVVDSMRLKDGSYARVFLGSVGEYYGCPDYRDVSNIYYFNGSLHRIERDIYWDIPVIEPLLTRLRQAGSCELGDMSNLMQGHGKLQLICNRQIAYDQLDSLLRKCSSYDVIYLEFW